MYCEHFGLDRQPFNNTPDPTFYYSTPEHEEALATLQYATQQRKGFVLITGEVGAGKTLIGRMFLRAIENEASTAVITHTHLSASQLLASICREFEIDYAEGSDNLQLAEKLQEYLLQQYARDRYVVVLLDEAQNLPDESFEALRMLGNLEADDAKLLQVCILGQPELRERFQQPSMKQINQRLFRRFHLPSLSCKQTHEYVHHRLAIAGKDNKEIFEADAIDSVYKASGGTPRVINQICDNALLTGYGGSATRITKAVIDQVLEGDSDARAGVSELMMEDTVETKTPEPEASVPESFSELPDPDHVSHVAMEQVDRIQEQIDQLVEGEGQTGRDMQQILDRQNELHKIVRGATTRWMSVKERMESYRKDIHQLIQELSSRQTTFQQQLREVQESAAPNEDLDEIRQMHMREVDRVIQLIEHQRSESTDNLSRLETHWSDLQQQVARLKAGTVQQEAFEPVCDRLEAWQTEVESFSETIADQVKSIKKQVRTTAAQLSVIPELKRTSQAHEEALQRVTQRLEELSGEISVRLRAAEESIELAQEGRASKSEFDQISREQQQALADLQTRIETLAKDTHGQIASAREQLSQLAQRASTQEAVADLEAKYDRIAETLTNDTQKRIASAHDQISQLAKQVSTREAVAELEARYDRIADKLENETQGRIASAQEEISRLAQQASTREAVAELDAKYDEMTRVLVERLETLQDEASHLGSHFADEFKRLREDTASVADLKKTRSEHEAALAEVHHRFEQIEGEMSEGLDAIHNLVSRLEDKAASTEDVEQFRADQKAHVARLHEALSQQASDAEKLRERFQQRLESMDEARKSELSDLSQRLDRQVEQVKSARQKFLEHHARVHNWLNELSERSATREEVEQLRQDQDERTTEVLTQVESSRRALLGMIDGVLERWNSTRQEMERFAEKKEVSELRARQEAEVDSLVSRLDQVRKDFETRFDFTLDGFQKLQSDKADKADLQNHSAQQGEALEALAAKQKEGIEKLIEDMGNHRRDVEYLVRSVNERCEIIRATVRNIPQDLPSGEEFAQLQERADAGLGELNAKWQELHERLSELAESSASAIRLESVEKAINENLRNLDTQFNERVNREVSSLSESMAGLNDKVLHDLDALTRRVDENVEGLDKRVNENVMGLSQEVHQNVEHLSHHVHTNVNELTHHVDKTRDQITEAHRQQTLHLRTIVHKMQDLSKRVFAIERTQPLQVTLTPQEVTDLKLLLEQARHRHESLNGDVARAESCSQQLKEVSTQIEDVMSEWSSNASAVKAQSDELRSSAGTARDLLQVMKRFHEALDAKLKSERWQSELERGEQLAARMEAAVQEARTIQQQLKAAGADSREERDRCLGEYEMAKSAGDRLARLVDQADDATTKFKGLLSGIMRSTSNINEALSGARQADETRSSRSSKEQEVRSVRNVQWPTIRTSDMHEQAS